MSTRARNEQRDEINSWSVGYTVDTSATRDWTAEQRVENDNHEALLVRPAPTENAICQCTDPEEAKWIAKRLGMGDPSNVSRVVHRVGRTKDPEVVRWKMKLTEES